MGILCRAEEGVRGDVKIRARAAGCWLRPWLVNRHLEKGERIVAAAPLPSDCHRNREKKAFPWSRDFHRLYFIQPFDIRFPILRRERLLGLSTSPIMAIYGDLPKLMHNALGRHCIPIDICVNPRYLCQHGKDRNIAELTINIQGETNFNDFLRLLSCNECFYF